MYHFIREISELISYWRRSRMTVIISPTISMRNAFSSLKNSGTRLISVVIPIKLFGSTLTQFQGLNSRSWQDKHHCHHKFLIFAPSVSCSPANWPSSFQTFFDTGLHWNRVSVMPQKSHIVLNQCQQWILLH